MPVQLSASGLLQVHLVVAGWQLSSTRLGWLFLPHEPRLGQANRFQFGGFQQVFGPCGLKQGGHLTVHSSGQRDVPKSLAFAALILCQTFRAATLPLNSSVRLKSEYWVRL